MTPFAMGEVKPQRPTWRKKQGPRHGVQLLLDHPPLAFLHMKPLDLVHGRTQARQSRRCDFVSFFDFHGRQNAIVPVPSGLIPHISACFLVWSTSMAPSNQNFECESRRNNRFCRIPTYDLDFTGPVIDDSMGVGICAVDSSIHIRSTCIHQPLRVLPCLSLQASYENSTNRKKDIIASVTAELQMTGTTGMTAFVAPGVPSDMSKSRRFHMRLMAALILVNSKHISSKLTGFLYNQTPPHPKLNLETERSLSRINCRDCETEE
ncbi:hypothetical protein MUK42_35858 [Musa troglodytarum]|uniref:Uncharacterized protein n=1 Tax=Musa troglodytarum TaxID=320322 RepID=A0A9E7KP28_9LILI|nr:hypothetical protein MUK42_35858 [Musa troglodytarum]